MSLLRVQNLSTVFKTQGGLVRACDNISFDLNEGEILGIVGESGSGKSVASLSIMGLIPTPPGYFDGGEILFKDRDLLKLSEKEMRKIRGADISMIFQDPMTALNPYLKVGTQLREVLIKHQGMSVRGANKKSMEMLEKVGVSLPQQRLDMYPHQLSGGLRQRVMIAMALLCEPDLLIADEPTTALDVTIQAQIIELIKDLNRDLGTSVIFISHNLGVVAGLTQRTLVMYGGKVVEEATTEELFANPQHPYTRALLKSIPRIEQDRNQRLIPIEGMPPDLSNLPTGCSFHPRCPAKIEKCENYYPDEVVVKAGHRASCWEVKS